MLDNGEVADIDIVKMAIDIAEALRFCHSKGIIHRDIKPANILYAPTDRFKLADFGIATNTEGSNAEYNTRKGTPQYMAPEIMYGKSYDQTVDIYSLGIVMYWYLNRRKFPFEPQENELSAAQNRETALIRRHNGEALPDPLDADSQLSMIIRKASNIRPADRYQTADLLIADLKDWLKMHTQASRLLNSVESADADNCELPTLEDFAEPNTSSGVHGIKVRVLSLLAVSIFLLAVGTFVVGHFRQIRSSILSSDLSEYIQGLVGEFSLYARVLWDNVSDFFNDSGFDEIINVFTGRKGFSIH